MMKTNVLLGALLLAAGTLLADTKDDVTTAANALAGKANYSWKMTIELGGNSNFKPGPTEGKTEKGGATLISISMQDNTIEAVKKGDKWVIKTEDGWQTLEEATAEGQQGPARFIAGRLRQAKGPAQEVLDLVGKSKSLKTDEGVVVGELTEEGAKGLMRFGGRRGGNGPEIANAKGSFKIWIKAGLISKLQYHFEGTVSFNGNDRDIDSTTTIEIKDVGNTKVTVPEEAAKKLS